MQIIQNIFWFKPKPKEDKLTDLMSVDSYITFFKSTQDYVYTNTTLLTYDNNGNEHYSNNVLFYVDRHGKENMHLSFDLTGTPSSLIEFLRKKYPNIKYYWKGQCLFVCEKPEYLKYNLYLYGKYTT